MKRDLRFKNIVITGGTGKVGTNVVKRLLTDGCRVRVLTRQRKASRHPRLAYVRGDLGNMKDVERVLCGADGILHLGAAVTVDPHKAFEGNVRGTFHLLEAARATGTIKRLVFASSDHVYGTMSARGAGRRTPLDERSEVRATDWYGLSKILCERMCRYYHENFQLPVVVARLSCVLSGDDVKQRLLSPFGTFGQKCSKRRRGMPGYFVLPLDVSGKPCRMRVIDPEDAVEGMVRALYARRGNGEVFNISGPRSFSFERVVKKMARREGKRFVVVRPPGLHSFDISIRKAKRVLGYRPTKNVLP